MSNVIRFSEAKNKQKHITNCYYNSLMALSNNLRNAEASLHEKIMIDFIESSKLDAERLVLFLKIVDSDKHLNSTLRFVLKTMTYEALRRMIGKLGQHWLGNHGVIDKLNNMVRVSEFWAKTSSKIDFSKIMPMEALISSLETSRTTELPQKLIEEVALDKAFLKLDLTDKHYFKNHLRQRMVQSLEIINVQLG